jgi:DNA-binding MarR family transcriptional regulator
VQSIADIDAPTQQLAKDLVAFVSYLQRKTAQDFMAIVGELELPFSHFKALMILDGAGELPLKALSPALGLSLAAASRAIDGLHRAGLVTRTEDPVDRRSKRIALTSDGQQLVERLHNARVEGMTAFVEELGSRDRAALARAIAPILDLPDLARCSQ